MGISERKERERQEMRDLILKVATQIFIEEGYDKTSIRKIADRIEYSPATIYLYFKEKDEIFHAIHEKGFEIFFQRMQETSTIENPFERLRQLCHEYTRFAYDYPEYYDLMFIMRAPMIKHLEQQDEWNCGFRAFNVLKNIVSECVEKGYMKETDVDVAAVTIWSCKHGITSLAIRERFKMYTEEQVQQLMNQSIEILMNSLKK